MLFDYVAAATAAGISGEQLERLRSLVRAEFPSDGMMRELHLLRVVRSIARGDVSLDEVLGHGATA